MTKYVTVYETGLRIGNKYSSFAESKKESDIDEYIEIMKKTCLQGEVVKYEKLYKCISTTPMSIVKELQR
jgi:hypothetical protein